MKQPLHVKLIREFIAEKDGRSFEEVRAYAEEIGASEESFEEAVYELSEENVDFVPSNHSLGRFKKKLQALTFDEIKKKVNTKRKAITLASFIAALIIVSVTSIKALSLQRNYSGLSLNTSNIENIDNYLSSESFGVQKVYAHQDKIDPVRVFSYPSSKVTLKFTGTPKKDILGFFPYWMLEMSDKINLTGITEVAIFGLTSDGKGNIVIQNANGENDEGFDMWNDQRLDAFINRARRQGIKILLTIKVFNNSDIESLSKNDENQKQLIANALELVKIKSLDGIVLDFEYVGKATENVSDGFSRLVGNMNSELKRENDKAKLYVATYLVGAVSPGFFDIQKVGLNSDKLIVMGYDVHTPKGDPGPVAPMHGNIDIVGSIEGYLGKIDKEKILLAVPYYGYDWAADTTDKNKNDGVAYAEIQAISRNSKIQWDETSQTPYFGYTDPNTGEKRVIHFENARSLGIKYDFVNSKDIAGVAIWALGYDGLSQELGQLILEKFAQ